MSICTKTGDAGTTGLMYNRRVPKTDPRVDAYGTVDELNAALGLARATCSDPAIQPQLLFIQKNLVILMGELATLKSDRDRYLNDGFEVILPLHITPLEELIKSIEAENVSFKGWATPGSTLNSAALDLARTTCRRAERKVCSLVESAELDNLQIPIFLNRLSDLLWLMARKVESHNAAWPTPS